MTSLLVGCKTVLYMAKRLKAYMDFLRGLPATLARTNFETAMTGLYVYILQFLARAIQIYHGRLRPFNARFVRFGKRAMSRTLKRNATGSEGWSRSRREIVTAR